MTPPPEYIAHRIGLFEKLKAEYDAEVKGLSWELPCLGKQLTLGVVL